MHSRGQPGRHYEEDELADLTEVSHIPAEGTPDAPPSVQQATVVVERNPDVKWWSVEEMAKHLVSHRSVSALSNDDAPYDAIADALVSTAGGGRAVRWWAQGDMWNEGEEKAMDPALPTPASSRRRHAQKATDQEAEATLVDMIAGFGKQKPTPAPPRIHTPPPAPAAALAPSQTPPTE